MPNAPAFSASSASAAIAFRWAGVAAPLQILSFYAMLRSMSSIVHDGYKALGRPVLMQRLVILV